MLLRVLQEYAVRLARATSGYLTYRTLNSKRSILFYKPGAQLSLRQSFALRRAGAGEGESAERRLWRCVLYLQQAQMARLCRIEGESNKISPGYMRRGVVEARGTARTVPCLEVNNCSTPELYCAHHA